MFPDGSQKNPFPDSGELFRMDARCADKNNILIKYSRNSRTSTEKRKIFPLFSENERASESFPKKHDKTCGKKEKNRKIHIEKTQVGM
jgi:hypothetical protein